MADETGNGGGGNGNGNGGEEGAPPEEAPPETPPETPPEAPPETPPEGPPEGPPQEGPPEVPPGEPGAPEAPPEPTPGAPGAPPPPPAPPEPTGPGLGGILGALEDQLAAIVNEIRGIVDSARQGIIDAIGQTIADVFGTAMDAVTAALTMLGDGLTSVANSVATADQVVETIWATLAMHPDEFGTLLNQWATNALGAANFNFLEFMHSQAPGSVDAVADAFRSIDGVPEWAVKIMDDAAARKNPIMAIAIPFILGISILPVIAAIEAPKFRKVEQAADIDERSGLLTEDMATQALFRDPSLQDRWHEILSRRGLSDEQQSMLLQATREIVSPDQAANMVVQSILDPDTAADEASRSGMDRERFDLLVRLAGNPPGPETMLDMWNRGIVSEQEATLGILQSRIKPEWTEQFKQLRFNIPTVSDVVRFMTRDAYIQDFVDKYGLHDEYDLVAEQADKAFEQLGVAPEQRLNYWAAHWELPGLHLAERMYQRTTTGEGEDEIGLPDGSSVRRVIGRDSLMRLYRAHGQEPFWRDKILATAFHAFTRVDIRRLNKTGILDESGVFRAYLDIGYDEEHARALTDFTLKLNEVVTKDQFTPYRHQLDKHIIALYARGKLDASDASWALHDLGFTDAEADALISIADLERTVALATKQEEGIKKLFVAGFIDDDKAISLLTDAGNQKAMIEATMADWRLDKQFRDLSEHQRHIHELTRNEVIQAFETGVLSEDEARKHLLDMGLEPPTIDVELAMADYRREKVARTKRVELIKQLYVAGKWPRDKVQDELDRIGTTATNRDILLDEWDLELERRTEQIPFATIRDMVRTSVIDGAGAREELKHHHYSDHSIGLILKLWGVS